MATAVLTYLRDHVDALYRYNGKLAFIKRGDDGAPKIRTADVHDIRMIVADYMQPFKRNRDGSRKDIALPSDVAMLMLAAANDIAAFRPLVGVTTAPLLRDDGSIYMADGYDPYSQLFCDHTNLPPLSIPEHPSEEDAKASLKAIRQIFIESPFADRITDRENDQATDLKQDPGHDESAFLNGLLLGVCRASMEIAPAIILRASDGNAGAGKTTLARAIANTAYGYVPKDTRFGEDMVEFDKTLLSELRTGPACVLFDNGNAITLRSSLLNLVLTSGHAHGRVLGLSEMADLTTRALVLMTGNALGVSADDIRRVLVSNLDARTEDPERRPVKDKEFLRDVIKPQRAELLRHLLIIWRWGRKLRGELKEGEALVSFDQYCRWVRDPLMALGAKDPVSRLDELKLTDPKRELQLTVFREWWRVHRVNTELRSTKVTAHGLSTKVCEIIDPDYGANSRREIISTLASWRGVRVAGFVLEHNAATKGKWSPTRYWLTREAELEGDDDDEASGAHGGETEEPDDPDGWNFNREPEAVFDFAGRVKNSSGFNVLWLEPEHPCAQCRKKDGQVYVIRDPSHGLAGHPLHEHCASAFYGRERRGGSPCESKWLGLSHRAVDQLAREVSGLEINGAARCEAAIRTRLVNSQVPAEALDIEIGKVMRRLYEMAETQGSSDA